jgi:pimeloyl-ACP methyl ester carboxylesterase
MSATTQKADEFAGAFSERFVQVDGLRIRYLEAGQGAPVVIFHESNELTPSQLHKLLARQFRVIAFEIPGFEQASGNALSSRDLARTLALAAAAAGVDRYVLVSASAGTPLALWQTIDAQNQVEALVLISPSALVPEGRTAPSGFPRDPELERRLGDIQTPTLVLLGTSDKVLPPETGRMYVERIPNCYYVLVYDAGHAIAAERPDALCAAVSDFIERRGTFIVERESTAINP